MEGATYKNWRGILRTIVALVIQFIMDVVLDVPGGLTLLGNSLSVQGFEFPVVRSPFPNQHVSEVASGHHKYVLVVSGCGMIGHVSGWSRRRTQVRVGSHTLTMLRFWSPLGEVRAYGSDELGFYFYHVQLHDDRHPGDVTQGSSSSTDFVHPEGTSSQFEEISSEDTKSFDEPVWLSTGELFETSPQSPHRVRLPSTPLGGEYNAQYKRARTNQESEQSRCSVSAEESSSSSAGMAWPEPDLELPDFLDSIFDDDQIQSQEYLTPGSSAVSTSSTE